MMRRLTVVDQWSRQSPLPEVAIRKAGAPSKYGDSSDARFHIHERKDNLNYQGWWCNERPRWDVFQQSAVGEEGSLNITPVRARYVR